MIKQILIRKRAYKIIDLHTIGIDIDEIQYDNNIS